MLETLRVSDDGDVTVAAIVENQILDVDRINQIGQELDQLIAALGKRKIVLSFAHVRQMSSRAFSVLVSLKRTADLHGADVVFCDLPHRFDYLFRVSRLHRLFDVFDNDAAATTHLRSA